MFPDLSNCQATLRLLQSVLVLFLAPAFPAASAALPDLDLLEGVTLGASLGEPGFTVSNGVVRVRTQGAGLGGRGDQGYFAFVRMGTADFDFKVRVIELEDTALSARAGLMVRDSATNSAAMAAIVMTPGMNGAQFVARSAAEGLATAGGAFPGNLPHAWLRLQRSNDVIRGFASFDGRRWTPLGRMAITMTNALVGFAVGSARTDLATSATFADWGEAQGDSTDVIAPDIEPPGPSSRRTALAITEIHYSPPRSPANGELPHQFIEVFNSDFTAKNLGGHRLEAGTLRYTFPTNLSLAPGGYLVVARNPDVLREKHPDLVPDRLVGPWQGDLGRATDTVQLWSPHGALLLEIPFMDRDPWPMGAEGEGHSLVLTRPSWGEANPRAWARSRVPGGSPGHPEFVDGDARAGLRISEVFTRRGSEVVPFIEVFNAGPDATPLDQVVISGPSGSDAPVLALPSGTLAPGDRLTVGIPATHLRTPPALFLREALEGRIWDAVWFGGADAGHALGRLRFDRPEMRRLVQPTPGLPNARALSPRLVISEVMYQPISGSDDDQFLEIWNPGNDPVPIGGWQLAGGVTFTFPATSVLRGGERAVIARNSARLQLTHPRLSAASVVGEFSGRLSARGERLALIDQTGAVEFGFTYRNSGEWPARADGGGSSLELLHPGLDPDLGSSWAASDESSRADWQTYDVTGVLEGGTGAINDVRVLLLGDGEALVDDVEVLAVGSTNLLANPGFETGITGWTAGGTHERTSLSTRGGFGGSAQALHLRALGRGDNGINSVRAQLRTGLRDRTNATLRLRARWLAGTRDLLLRVKGNYLELPVRLQVPLDLGTPAQPNSRTLISPRPALSDLSHYPVLPAEDQPVRISVRVNGDAGDQQPMLRHRLDPAPGYGDPVPMNDAGVEGDLVAGDGLFTAWLPGRPARSMSAFQVLLGTDSAAFRVPRSNTSTNPEALVRWGETQPAGNLGAYRIWITRANETRWTGRPKLHNGDLDGTFVYGSARAIYGLGTLYSGSPFVSPGYNGPAGSTLCGYVLHFPDDDAFLGETDFVMDWPIRDDTRQLEQRAYEFAAEIGLPYLHRRFVHFYVNSTRRGSIYEDTQQPGGAYLRNWSPGDDDGNLHKIEDWFEFNALGEMEGNNDARLEEFRRSDGTRNTARYRWNFRPRSVQESAHDFSALYRLLDAAVPPSHLLEFQRELEREMDIEEWAGVFAVEHAVGNWDSFGYNRGKNMYAYRPTRGPWRLYFWDIDFVMSAGGDGPGNWPYATIDGTVAKLYQFAPFQRAYWRAMKKLVDGPMLPARFNARTEAVRLGLADNGVNSVNLTDARNFVRDQRTSLMAELTNLDRPFTYQTSLENGITTDASITLQGEGPLAMVALKVNDEILPVTWFLANRWFVSLPLREGRQAISLVPVDAAGLPLGAVRTFNATLTEPPLPEIRRVVINEIHANPANSGAGFIELFNPSPNQSFPLANLQLTGSGSYTFPANAVLGPSQYLVLGSSVAGFQQEFGRTAFPAALLPWTLDPLGETVALVRPAVGTRTASTITAVSFEPSAPWPTPVPGRSLQLRDASRGDDDRVGNWAVYAPATNASAWQEFSVTGPAAGTNLVLYVSSFPPPLDPRHLRGRWIGSLSAFGFDFGLEVSSTDEGGLAGTLFPGELPTDPDTVGSALGRVSSDATGAVRFTWNDLAGQFVGRIDASGRRATGTFTFEGGTSPFAMTRSLPPGTVLVDDLRLTRADDASNLLRDGGFDAALGTDWQAQGPHLGSGRTDHPLDAAAGSPTESVLRLSGTLGGSGSPTNAVSQAVSGVVTGVTYRISGRYQTVEAQGLVIGLEGGPHFTADLRPKVSSGPDATPGRPNSVKATTAPLPSLWLNEIQPENLDGPLDASGRTEPWLELHNSGATALSLDGYQLSDDPLQPGKWTLPPGSSLPAGGFLLVWLDGESAQGTAAEPHAPFRPTARDGIIVLSRTDAGTLQPVDYLRYTAVPPGRSFGHLPETWVHADDLLPRPTPRQPNGSGVQPPTQVWINEWMASNDGSVRDPADQDSDDWFELYNPGATAVDLSGWFLTDIRTEPTKFRIPAGYLVPARGFLVVWADEEGGQNRPERPDLHVNFRLGAGGEEILLSRPDGTPVDHVIFGAQLAGVSQGRATDGAPGTQYVFLPASSPGRANAVGPDAPPNVLAIARRADGSIVLSFVSQPGTTYRIRTKEELGSAVWTPSGVTVTATGSTAELVWTHDDAPHRFLQVERAP